jgi:hypothetical protein
MADAVVGGDRCQRLAGGVPCEMVLGRFLARHGVEPPPPVRDRNGAVVVHADVLHLGRDVTALGSHEERSQRLPARFGLVNVKSESRVTNLPIHALIIVRNPSCVHPTGAPSLWLLPLLVGLLR